MAAPNIDSYNVIRSGGTGYIELPRGLIAVGGGEAVKFLDGMITNDLKTLEDGGQMLAAFPTAQGRLIAVVRVLRQGDRFLIETEEATRVKLFENLFRFTYAGDFLVEDLSDAFRYFEIFGGTRIAETPGTTSVSSERSNGVLVPVEEDAAFREKLDSDGAVQLDDATFEVLRIESGQPRSGIDMDETTIVPELGLATMISYTKGCYVGQEIVARIHFRGHVAKQLSGLILASAGNVAGDELLSQDGRNAGRMTSVCESPAAGGRIALAAVRYDFLAPGTVLSTPNGDATVSSLPFKF